MELIFKTNSGVELRVDADGNYVSTNPAEVLASIFEDLKSANLFSKVNARILLLKVAEKGGIYYAEEGPKRVLSDKRLIFLASDSEGNNLFGCSSASKFDVEAYNRLNKRPTILHVAL